jgi:hypothetical protein
LYLVVLLTCIGPHADRDTALQSIFVNEKHILWPQRISKKRVHILIHLTSHSLESHFRAWAHAYVLSQLVTGTSFPSGKTDDQILGKEAGEVHEALRIMDTAFGQGVGILEGLRGRGWDVARSMMCPNMEGRVDWGREGGEDDDAEKGGDEMRAVDIEKRD